MKLIVLGDRFRVTRNSDVMRLGSSSRAPLLAPSPLRTGLEGFPFIRLEHPKNAPMKNEDAA